MIGNNPTKYGVVVVEETNDQRSCNVLTPQGNRFCLKVIIFIFDIIIYNKSLHIHQNFFKNFCNTVQDAVQDAYTCTFLLTSIFVVRSKLGKRLLWIYESICINA